MSSTRLLRNYSLLLGVWLLLVQPCAGGSGVFANTGSLGAARESHTATLLPGGKVLVAGGFDVRTYFVSAELYDTATGIWTATGSLATARAGHTATLLPNGKVLVAGGFNPTSGNIASAELYDPASGTWTATGNLVNTHVLHTATLLPNGKVLVTGGLDTIPSSAELYDPASGTWTATGDLIIARNGHTATLLPNGKVLAAGGNNNISSSLGAAELYDPAAGTWRGTGSFVTARYDHTATLLPNGKVLVAAGTNSTSSTITTLASAELYDTASGTWAATGSLATARAGHTATLLPNGKVLAAGGADGDSSPFASAELYDSTSGTWTVTGGLNGARAFHTATLLPNGKVLVAGGSDGRGGLATAELYVAPPSLVVIASPLNAAGTVAQQFVYQFEARSASSLSVNNLPPGLTFVASLQAIIGTPTAAGTFQAGLTAMGSSGTSTAALTIVVQPIPVSGPIIASSTAATGRVGRPFSFQVYTINGTTAARISASGLPPGLDINSVTGRISGTPIAEGSSAATLTVTDGSFTTSSILQLTFAADPARPVIISPNTASLSPGQPFSYTINAPSSADPSDPTIFTLIGTLPAGLSFNAATGTISGTYTGPLGPDLAGGALLGSIQLFATNSHGTSTFQLLFRAPAKGVVNIATRTTVGTGDNVLIGGFIITGNAPKIIIVRAIGPSLPIPGLALEDPMLELHDSAGGIVPNDNWRSDQEQIILESGLQPSDERESAIVAGLAPGAYTAIVHGKNDTTGIALVELYDLGTASLDIASGDSKLGNIATRGFVNTFIFWSVFFFFFFFLLFYSFFSFFFFFFFFFFFPFTTLFFFTPPPFFFFFFSFPSPPPPPRLFTVLSPPPPAPPPPPLFPFFPFFFPFISLFCGKNPPPPLLSTFLPPILFFFPGGFFYFSGR